MQPSIIGILVAGVIYVLDRRLSGGLVLGLMVSLAFGATAFAVLTAVGGSSPLIYTLFAMALTVALAFRRRFIAALREVVSVHPIGWVIILLLVYVLGGAYILPRIFAGETIVFVVERGVGGTGGVTPERLAPHFGNITQALYFALSAFMYFTVLAVALDADGIRRIRLALFGWAIALAVTGYADLIGKLAGLGDVLEPIRTASYSMLTSESHAIAGLPRVSGAFAEASAFAGAAVPACVFAFASWRFERRLGTLVLAILLLMLLVLSTSTTAYVTLAICGLVLGLSTSVRLLMARIHVADAVLLAIAAVGLIVLLGAYLYNDRTFYPFLQMIDSMVLNKASSSSVMERGTWNAQAWQALMDTWGFGVGIGSTRTSGWLAAVPSHLGALGACAMFATVLVLFRGLGGLEIRPEHRGMAAVSAACRAAALASIVAASLVSPTADPGVFYFFALAAIVATRHHVAVGNASAVQIRPRQGGTRPSGEGELRPAE